ncbi:dolichol kinase [[Candida] railenensis]|uniref:dolichol kinase n=1 Tax=[Candida] railenensis TaxID=45579 RepID=A0A9P0QQ00_9ASCO|nr:dolichol kinase [[Candida] railenensis]
MSRATRSRASKELKSADAGSRSTASIFLNSSDQAPTSVDADDVGSTAVTDAAEQGEAAEENDDPSNYIFPLYVIYTIQDFLNDNMTPRAFVQWLIVLYTANLIYMNHLELLLENYQVIGFNFLGVTLALILAHYSASKSHSRNFENPAPSLPEFNHLYSIVLPTGLTLLSWPQDMLLNLSLNYFTIDQLPLLARVVLTFMYYYVYTDESVVPFKVLQSIACYVVINHILTFVSSGNEGTAHEVPEILEKEDDKEELLKIEDSKHRIGTGESLQKSEIHLLTLLAVKLLVNNFPVVSSKLPEENIYIPLIILQKLFIALIVSGAVTWPFCKYYQNIDLVTDNAFLSSRSIICSLLIAMFGALFVLLSNYQLDPILGQSPIFWLHDYITKSEERLHLIKIWSSILVFSISVIFISSYKLSLNSRRKIWHSVILFILLVSQPLINQPIFTLIALFGSFIVLLLVELVRYNRLTFIGEALYNQLIVFQDSKDLKGPLNCSYIFLLLGITIPIVLDFYEHGAITVFSYLGIVYLGIGDSTASIIGKSFGTLKWTGSYKSIQGTLAFFVITLVSFFGLEYFLAVQFDWESIFITCIIGSLLEGSSDMNDNLLIPCYTSLALKALTSTKPV